MTTTDPPKSSNGSEALAGSTIAVASAAARKPLSDAARRALAEAEARRAARVGSETASSREVKGRGGLDPVRYGDWEVKGLASDF
jgi:hypothetical protein